MQIDTKYALGLMRRVAGSKVGALALAMDRLCYDMHTQGASLCVRNPMYVGKDGGCGWVATVEGKPEYVDSEKLLRLARDELYAVALGEL